MKRITIVSISFAFMVSLKCYGAEKPESFLEGFIVTTSNDTLKGWILLSDHDFNSRKCVFKKTPNGQAETFSPDQLAAYWVAGQKRFETADVTFHEVGGEVIRRAFLECIVSSRLSLFFLRDRYFIKTPQKMDELLVIEEEIKAGARVYVSRQPKYKLTLRQEMVKCLHIDEYLGKTEFKLKSLKQLFINYMNCTGEQFNLYGSQHEHMKIHVSLLPAIQTTSLKLKSGGSSEFQFFDKGTTDSKSSFAASVIVEFYRKELSNRPRFKTGITYYNNTFDYVKDLPSGNLNYHLTINSSRIEVPLLVKLPVLRGNTSVYLQGGIGLNTNIAWKDNLVVTVPPDYILREGSNLKPSNFSVNFQGGAGIDFAIGKQSIVIDLSYGMNPFVLESRTNSPSATIHSFSVGAGIKF